MVKNKNNLPFWGTRIKSTTSNLFQRIGSSLDIDKKLFREDIQGSIAHVEMLFKQKIINFKIKNKIIYGLKKIEKEILKKKFNFDINFEDIHMNIERRLYEIIGDEAAYLHTARSRNDQVVTDLKIWMKKSNKKIQENINQLVIVILKLADKNIYTIMPGLTHLKSAQPVSFAHYLMSYIEMLNRDKKRFSNCLELLSENPLGVAALTGSSFNINREITTKKLGFKKPTENSIDTVGDRDFVLEFLYCVAMCSIHISRICEDLIIWNSDEFNFIKLSDNIVTGSSIMPQKKNPDALEFLRGKTGSAFGNLFAMMTILKGLPSSYFKDLQDDKELVFKSDELITNSLNILKEVFNNISANKAKMLKSADTGFILSTDLVDYIVKKNNLPFRTAYNITAKIVNYAEKRKKNIKDLSIEDLKKIEPRLTPEVFEHLNLKNSVKSKKTYGGTSFENIKKMIKKYKKIY